MTKHAKRRKLPTGSGSTAGTPHATIDTAIALRRGMPAADESPITCAACGKVRQCGGAITVKIVSLSAEARRGMQAREDMLPLCAECVRSPADVSSAVVRRNYYPDLHITAGGYVRIQ
jgi:hypothetical protein